MIAQRDLVKNMILTEKTTFYHSALDKAGTDRRTMFRIFQELLSDYKTNPLPDVPPKANANDFNVYFVDKIRRLKERFNENMDPKPHDGNCITAKLERFAPVDLDYVLKLIRVSQVSRATWTPFLRAFLSQSRTQSPL